MSAPHTPTHHENAPATGQSNGLLTSRGKKTLGKVAKYGSIIAGTAAATALALSSPGCKRKIDPINPNNSPLRSVA